MRLDATAARRRGPALTALVDVVFILLFFFMLAARPPAPQVLELQSAGAASEPVGTGTRSAVVTAHGRVHFDGRELAPQDLARELQAASPATIALGVDASATLQDLIDVVDALRMAGVTVELTAGAP